MHLGNRCHTFNKLFGSLFAFILTWGLFVTPAYAATNEIVTNFTNTTLNIFIAVGALFTTVFLIRGGYLYITSTGNPIHLEEAKKTIKNAILGLVLIISASVFSSMLNNAFTTPANGTNLTQIALTPIQAVKPADGLTRVLLDAFNGFIQNIVTSATKPILDGIISFLSSTPSVITNSVIFNYWLVILGIVDSLFAIVLAILGFQVMSSSSFGFEEIEFKHILPRVGLAFLGANMSIFLADWIIQISNTLVNALLATTGGIDKAWVLNVVDITKLITNTDQTIIITMIFALLFLILCIVLLFMYVSRLILVAFGAVMSPFVFLLWALPKTSGMAEAMVKSYFATVFIIFVHVAVIQLASAFLAIPGQVGTNSLLSIIIAIGLLFTLIRIPQWLFFLFLIPSRGGAMLKVGSQIMNILANGRTSTKTREAASQTNEKVVKPRNYLKT